MNMNSSGGYQFEVCGEENQELICPICFCLLRDAMEMPCTHTACSSCLQRWEKEQGEEAPRCPSCQSIYKPQEVHKGKKLDRIITTAMKVKCKQHTEDCQWTGTISDYQIHEKSCEYRILSCKKMQCDFKGTKEEMEYHLTQCSYRVLNCIHCQQEIIANRIEDHNRECEYFPVKCPIEECDATVRRNQISEHTRRNCLFIDVPCNFSPFGCDIVVKKIVLADHLNNYSKHHSVMVTESFARIKEECATLKSENSAIKLKYIEDLHELQNQNDEYKKDIQYLREELDKTKRKVTELSHESKNLMYLTEEERHKRSWSFEELAGMIASGNCNKFVCVLSINTSLARLSGKTGETLMHVACVYGRKGCIDLLIKFKCTLIKPNRNGNLPIHIAASRGKLDIVAELLSRDPSLVNVAGEQNFTILHCAVYRRHRELVEFLLSQPDLDVNLKNKKGKKAYDLGPEFFKNYPRNKEL